MRTPVPLRASARTFAAGAMLAFDTTFLRPSTPMDAPEIAYMILRFTGSVTAASGKTIAGRALIGEIASRCFFTDAKGDAVSASTYSLRQWAQRALGEGYVDPANLTSTTATVDIQLVIPFELRRGQIPSDWRKPVDDFSGQGGQLRVQCGPGTITNTDGTNNSTVNSGNIELWAFVVDAGTRRATSRLQIKDYAVNGQDFRYPVEGLLTDMWLSGQPSDIAQANTLTAQSFTSDGLFYMSFDSTVMKTIYEQALFSVSASDDVVAGLALNFFNSQNYQSQAELPDLQEVQMRLSTTAPTNGVVVVCSVTQRAAIQVAQALGVPASQLASAQASAVSEGKNGGTGYKGQGKLAGFLPVANPKATAEAQG